MRPFVKLAFSLLFVALCHGSLWSQGGVRMSGDEKAVVDPVRQNFLLAKEYYQKGEYEKALTYLEKLYKKQRSSAIYTLTLDCYLAIEDYKKAESLIADYIRNIRGNNARYHADMVYVYLEQDKQAKADKFVEDIMAKVEASPGVAYSFGDAFQKRGFPRIALEIFETAERRMPSANYDYQKALLYGELGDIKTMYATYVTMVERSPNYLGTVKQLLARALSEEQTSENSEYLKQLLIERIQQGGSQNMNDLLIFIFIQEKNFNGAFVQLKALDRRNKGNKAEIYNLGKVAINNKEYALAGRIFDYIIKAGPDYPFYESALGKELEVRKLELLERNTVAREEWQSLRDEHYKVLKLMKGDAQMASIAISTADISAFQLDESDTAVGVLKELINTGYVSKEDVARAKIKLGDVLLYKGERWEAILYYGQAEKAFEQSPIGQEAKFKRAKAAYFVGDFKWAQGIFDALKSSTSKLIANDAMSYSMLINDNIALDTNTEAMALYAKADLMNYQNKYDSALRVLDMMDIAFPGHEIQDEVLLLKSTILKKQNRYEEAVQALETLVGEYEDGILADDALYALAQLYENELNQPEKAQELYQKLFTEHPDSFFTSDARKRFRILRGDAVIN